MELFARQATQQLERWKASRSICPSEQSRAPLRYRLTLILAVGDQAANG